MNPSGIQAAQESWRKTRCIQGRVKRMEGRYQRELGSNQHTSVLASASLLTRCSCWSSLATQLCLVTQPCLTLCDSWDCSPPGCSIHEIFQAGLLEWVAISSSRGSSCPRDRTKPTSPVSPALQTDSLPPKPLGKPSH